MGSSDDDRTGRTRTPTTPPGRRGSVDDGCSVPRPPSVPPAPGAGCSGRPLPLRPRPAPPGRRNRTASTTAACCSPAHGRTPGTTSGRDRRDRALGRAARTGRRAPVLTVPSGAVVTLDTVATRGSSRTRARTRSSTSGTTVCAAIRPAGCGGDRRAHAARGPGPHVVVGRSPCPGRQRGDVLKVEMLRLAPRVPTASSAAGTARARCRGSTRRSSRAFPRYRSTSTRAARSRSSPRSKRAAVSTAG